MLEELVRYTWRNYVNPRQLSGPVQGRWLSMVSKMISPQNILEIGTFSGYSAICLSEGLRPGGMVHTIEADAETAFKTKKFLAGAQMEEKIKVYTGSALEVLKTLEIAPELSFIDGNKQEYPFYFEVLWPKVPRGGMVVFDNTLWNGRVTDIEDRNKDADTAHMHAFNVFLRNVEGAEVMILPLRDGLTMVRKY